MGGGPPASWGDFMGVLFWIAVAGGIVGVGIALYFIFS